MQELRLFKVQKISTYCGSHVGGQKNAHQSILPYNFFSLKVKLFLFVQISSNLVQRHVVWSYRPCPNLEQIDNNLYNNFLMNLYANHHIEKKPLMKPEVNQCYNASDEDSLFDFQINLLQDVLKLTN